MAHHPSEAAYLASLIPASVAGTPMARRSVLRGALLAGGVLGGGAALSACGGGGEESASSESPTGSVGLGSNENGTTFADQRVAMADAFRRSTGVTVDINAVDHNTFQENINTYLQGNADDVFSWFAGFRMRFFAESGLIGDISDVYPLEGIPDSFMEAATGDDGNQYFVPQSYYPWAVFHRRSVFEERGYSQPTTLEELVSLCDQMMADDLVPIAFGDSDGWPAMGTFDMLNMRTNGFDYHIALMAGEESWESAEVKAVFAQWRDLLPYHQPAALGRTWQEAAQSLQRRESGMYIMGTFLNEQFPDDEDDLDLFTFPEIDSAIGSTAIDAPIDGFCMSANPENEAAAKALLRFMSTPEAAEAAATTGLPFIAANTDADTSQYSALQVKSAELVAGADNIAQFLDRDTRPDFASTVIIPALQEFIGNPDDVDALCASIQEQKVSIFGS